MDEARKRSNSCSSAPRGSSHARRKKSYEKAVDLGRKVVPHGTAFVDNKNAISEVLAAQASAKAFMLTATYRSGPEDLGEDEDYFGQAGLICGKRLAPSPEADSRQKRRKTSKHVSFVSRGRFTAVPFTAKHNIEPEEDEIFKSTKVGSPRISGSINLTFPDAGFVSKPGDAVEIRPAAGEAQALVWIMMDRAQAIAVTDARSQLTERSLQYEKVPDGPQGFKLSVGQKVGIAVYRTFDIDFEDAQINDGDVADMKDLYGRKHSVSILTGEISFVKQDGSAIEHTVNTFRGCSGAIIFLLDKNQGEDVDKEHFGKAVAVHVGADVDLPRNVGFTL